MALYKIIYNSEKVKFNRFSVEAINEKEAKKEFKKQYISLGGNWDNVKNILSIEDLKTGESLNDFFKK